MLVLSRKIEEGIRIGAHIDIKILNVFSTDNTTGKKSKAASIGIDAPREIAILRKELKDTLEQNQAAQQSARDISGADIARIMQMRRTLGK